MPFIYKPFRQTMSPQNEPINPAVNNIFSVAVNGQVCNGYRFRIFDMNNNLISAPSTNLVTLPVTWINDRQYLVNDIVYYTSNSKTYKCILENTSPSIWALDIAYKIGDKVYYDVNGLYYTCIANHTSTSQLPPIETAYWEQDLTPFIPTNILYWTEVTSGTLYDGDILNISVAKNSLEAGNQYKWQVDMYSTILTISSVDTTNDTMAITNHNLLAGDIVYIDSTGNLPTANLWAANWSNASEIYIVGDRVFYATNSTYYKCKQQHTSSDSILPTNTTYWDVESPASLTAYTKYYVRPYDKNNILLYDNIEAAKNGRGNINIITAGDGTITISNIALSDEIPFTSYSEATFELTVGTIEGQSYTFIPIYSHPEGILVNKFEAFLYNSANEIIDQSGETYSSNVRYFFNGFLTNETYGVRFVATNNSGQESDTGIIQFNVSYSAPNIMVSALAENICKDSCVKVSWPDIYQIYGVVDGTSQYIENYITYGWYGLHLDNNSTLTYNDVNMKVGGSLPIFLWQPDATSFVGLIAEFINSENGSYIQIGYDGNRFYQDRDGIVLNNAPLELTQNGVYLISIVDVNLYTNLITTL
jgi:hypothetical protein